MLSCTYIHIIRHYSARIPILHNNNLSFTDFILWYRQEKPEQPNSLLFISVRCYIFLHGNFFVRIFSMESTISFLTFFRSPNMSL